MLRIRILAFAILGAFILPTGALGQEQWNCGTPELISPARGARFTGTSSNRRVTVTIRAEAAGAARDWYRISVVDPALPNNAETQIVPAGALRTAEAQICGTEWAKQYGGVNWGSQQQAAKTNASALPGDGALQPRLGKFCALGKLAVSPIR
jgi:hypothetical protein